MVTEAVEQLAEELPEHQSKRGDEFRDMDMPQRRAIAQKLVQARSQANASNADWESNAFRSEMIEKRVMYSYYAGKFGIDPDEAREIWWSVVYNNPSPYDRRKLV